MIRPFTCLSVLLAAGSGLYLYSEKHRTTLLDDRIRAVVEDTHRIEDRTSMLRAEWALLNQPDRLQALATKFLPALAPIQPTQFVQMAELDKHLPAVGAPPVPAAPQATTVLPVAAPPPMTLASAETVVPAPAAPVAPAAPHHVAPAVRTVPALRLAGLPHRAVPTAATPHHRVMIASAAIARPARTVDPVRDAAYMPRAPMAASTWRPAAAPVAQAYGGSALGMAGGAAIAPPMAAPMAAPMAVR